VPDELVNVRYMVDDIVSGPGGQQILLEDPAGNPIELFQPAGA
jgi:hypothetical protein